MATSGSTTFNLDLAEIVEEAFERCGLEVRSGYDLRTARRSLNLLLASWANQGINLWTVEQGVLPLVAGQATYALPDDTVDILEQVIRTGSGQTQSDIAIPRIAFPDYAVLPNKNATGRPLQVMVSRQVDAPYVTFYPVPDDAAPYLFVYWRMRRMQDAGSGANTMDVPFRVLPALVAGLAYYLCTKLPGAEGRVNILKAQYDEAWSQMASEDRDRAPVRLTPRIGRV